MKIENSSNLPSQSPAHMFEDAMRKSSYSKVLPADLPNLKKNCKLKTIPFDDHDLKNHKTLGTRLRPEEAVDEKSKLELRNLNDGILQGKLLLDRASHKLNDYLLFDQISSSINVKQDFEKDVDEKHLGEKLTKCLESSQLNHQNNNNVIEDAKVRKDANLTSENKNSVKEFVKCKWKDCDQQVEVQHLLEHLIVSSYLTLSTLLHFVFIFKIKQLYFKADAFQNNL